MKGRSTFTVKLHVDKHNEAVSKIGYCPMCRRAGSPLEAKVLKERPVEAAGET